MQELVAAWEAKNPFSFLGRETWKIRLPYILEGIVWAMIVAILLILRLSSSQVFEDKSTLWLTILIISFGFVYYTLIIRLCNNRQRHFIKDLAEVMFIGLLGSMAKDYSIYFFTLYIFPVAAAAFALGTISSLFITAVACTFITFNIMFNPHFLASIHPIYFGSFQIVFLLLVTMFAQALALELAYERSQRSFIERTLKEAAERLRSVEAMEEEFVSLTAHQLNTPLSIIRGYASMMAQGDAGKLNEKQTHYAEAIHAGSLRLAKLVKDLLDITRFDEEKPLKGAEKIVVEDLMKQCVRLFTSKALERNITLNTILPKDTLVMSGSTIRLEQAFNNLLDNAIKYSNENSSVEIKVEKDPKEKQVIFTITDHGIGIPKDEQGLIFERFYRASNTTDKDNRGSGLGLYFVKRIIEGHRGTIHFHSEQNQGTTFTIRLPLTK